MSGELNLESYGYDLPGELIAQHPLVDRDQARLLVVNRQDQSLTHDYFYNLSTHLPKKSLIVLNESKVIPARLLAERKTGGKVEVFLLKRLDNDTYEALIKPLKKIKEGEEIHIDDQLVVTLIDKEKRIVRFNRGDVLEYLQKVGHIPLPPYITREDNDQDKEYYQTVYAKEAGSVASPTAGLHFTEKLLEGLSGAGHDICKVTLHVNYGTFKPVEEKIITDHKMHYEHYAVAKETHKRLREAKGSGQKIAVVGTTSCRTLETVAKTSELEGETNLFIYPGYDFRMVDTLITNFHLPYSTLLMLVSAFGGRELIMKAYEEAVAKKYRFYSYGDAMIIL